MAANLEILEMFDSHDEEEIIPLIIPYPHIERQGKYENILIYDNLFLFVDNILK